MLQRIAIESRGKQTRSGWFMSVFTKGVPSLYPDTHKYHLLRTFFQYFNLGNICGLRRSISELQLVLIAILFFLWGGGVFIIRISFLMIAELIRKLQTLFFSLFFLLFKSDKNHFTESYCLFYDKNNVKHLNVTSTSII